MKNEKISHSPSELNRNELISSMKRRVEEAFTAQVKVSGPVISRQGNNIKKDNSRVYTRKVDPKEDPSDSPFPLSNILTRRLSNMSTFSSTSSSMDDTSSDDNGVADNEDDSGEPSVVTKDDSSSAYAKSRKRKGKKLNKKQTVVKSSLGINSLMNKKKGKLKTDYINHKDNQQNFKSIQKGIEDILNSDALLKEDLESTHTSKNEQIFTEDDDEDSKDSSKPDAIHDPLANGACSKKKAKALINCFRSFAVKPK